MYIYIGKHRHFSNPTSRAGRIFVEYFFNGTPRQEAKRRALALETVDQVGNGGRHNQFLLSSASFFEWAMEGKTEIFSLGFVYL